MKMDYKAIKELIEAVDKSNLSKFEITSGELTVKMEKNPVQIISEVTQKVVEPKLQVLENKFVEKHEDNIKIEHTIEADTDSSIDYIKSPIVGTIYMASSPDSEPFVKAGSTLVQGQTVCIVEAMKLMNEIESEFDGEIIDVLVNDKEMVEYGQPLFRVRKRG